jgi:voltage-gated potassium channel
MTEAPADEQRNIIYEFFILAVSILSVINLALLFTFPFRSQYWWLVVEVDIALTIIFVTDFGLRFHSADSKRRYMGRGGGTLDLLACTPALRIFRIFRIVRAWRRLRALGGPGVLREVRSQLASGTLYFVIFLLILTLESVGLLELYFEMDAPGANITTGGDALWWGYVTATTVGYGDKYPVTAGGRIAGLVMLTVGVALFATFSGFLANLFLRTRAAKTERADAETGAALDELDRLLAEQQSATAALRARLVELDQA